MAAIISSIWQSVGGTAAQPESEKDVTTPKATPVADTTVPTFSLSEDDETASIGSSTVPGRIRPTQTSDSAALSAPIAPPPRASGLMPPPRGPALPLPNRGPPTNSQQRVGSNSRGKVLLSPGHSPMDWASLTRTSNLSGVPSLQRVTPSQMKKMNGRKGTPIWSSYQGKVYNITPYLPFHPGGEKELLKSAGRDGTKLFMEIHPWVNWENMLSACLVGILVSEDVESELDSID